MAEKIGEGLQYRVYRVENTKRVKKVPKQRNEMIDMASEWYESRPKAVGNVEMSLERRDEVASRLDSMSLPDYILGNPELEEGTVYQDLVEPVNDRMDKIEGLDAKKLIIEDYIDLVHTLWSYGVGDTVYNFTLNNGYDEDDRIIQMDFGELVFSKQKILEAIEEDRWEDQRSLDKDLSGDLKKYGKERIGEELTEQKLKDLWRSEI